MGKTTKGFILGLTTAAAALGAYYVYQNRDKIFKTEEIVNEDGTVTKKRSYVDLSDIKNKTNDAVNKTKETAQDTWEKAKDKIENRKKSKKNKDDVVVEDAVEIVEEAVEEAVEKVAEETTEA